MASVEAVPACLLAAPPQVVQPPHLEGDSSLATEILPGPPSLVTIQQLGLPKKDHKKSVIIASYLPASDPGTTYGANTVSTMATLTEADGPRRKRARLDKGCVLLLLYPLLYPETNFLLFYAPTYDGDILNVCRYVWSRIYRLSLLLSLRPARTQHGPSPQLCVLEGTACVGSQHGRHDCVFRHGGACGSSSFVINSSS